MRPLISAIVYLVFVISALVYVPRMMLSCGTPTKVGLTLARNAHAKHADVHAGDAGCMKTFSEAR